MHILLVVCGTLDHMCAAMHKAAHIGNLHELIESHRAAIEWLIVPDI